MTMVSCNGMIFFIPALTPRVLVTVSGRNGLHVLSGEGSLEKWIVVCPNCHASGDPYRFTNRSGILRCRHCQHNTYLTVGTVMERSHTPLMVWFWVAFWSPVRLQVCQLYSFRQLGLSRYETAFQILHKLDASMVRSNQDRIGGTPGVYRSRRELIPIIDRPENISNT